MRHFHIPLVSRKRHDERIRELSREKERLEERLKGADAKLEQFRAAQNGECAKSPRCSTCDHCLRYSAAYGPFFTLHAECDLDFPQCKHYSPKE